jgi:hypothetical protein
MKKLLIGLLTLGSISSFASVDDLQSHTWQKLPVQDAKENNKFIGGKIFGEIKLERNQTGSFESEKFSTGVASCSINSSRASVLSAALGDKEVVFVDTNSFGDIQKSYYSIAGYTYEKSLLKKSEIIYLNCEKEGSFLTREDVISALESVMRLKKIN